MYRKLQMHVLFVPYIGLELRLRSCYLTTLCSNLYIMPFVMADHVVCLNTNTIVLCLLCLPVSTCTEVPVRGI